MFQIEFIIHFIDFIFDKPSENEQESVGKPPMRSTTQLYKRLCGVNFEWYAIDESSTLNEIEIEACSMACQDDESCEYFRWHRLDDKNFQQNIGNCSLFGTNYQPKLVYCIKKGILYQS